jgi:hypothetical protein
LISYNKDDAKYLNGLLCQLCRFTNESASPLQESLAYSLVSLYFDLRRVSLAEYFFRTQGVVPIVVADGQMYFGYCIKCLYPVMGDN